eukprot:m.487040 g.487040  ORF g.487040 m.487040 type:complete len:186 (-) comp57219_c0_seq4:2045-2602(-)
MPLSNRALTADMIIFSQFMPVWRFLPTRAVLIVLEGIACTRVIIWAIEQSLHEFGGSLTAAVIAGILGGIGCVLVPDFESGYESCTLAKRDWIIFDSAAAAVFFTLFHDPHAHGETAFHSYVTVGFTVVFTLRELKHALHANQHHADQHDADAHANTPSAEHPTKAVKGGAKKSEKTDPHKTKHE